jgi:hypothetical protein
MGLGDQYKGWDKTAQNALCLVWIGTKDGTCDVGHLWWKTECTRCSYSCIWNYSISSFLKYFYLKIY